MPAPASYESLEAKELGLVGKLELRIALADSDTKLESLLRTYLAPLLLKLASEHVAVRNKVIAVCQHLNTRIQPPSIKLPVAALLKQYKEQRNPLIRHFDLLYVQQGFDRLSSHEKLDLLPIVLARLSQNYDESATNAASLFNLFLRLIHQMKLPLRGSKEDQGLRVKLALDQGIDAEFLATWIGKLILFHSARSTSENSPGLTAKECDFLQMNSKPDTWNSTASAGLNLTDTKVVATKFLASGAFNEQERFLPALFASADHNSRLSDVADDILKTVLPAISLEDPNVIERLYRVYLGTSSPEYRPPVRTPLQIKILGLFCKSHAATGFGPEILSIVRDGLSIEDLGASGSARQGLEASRLRAQVFNFTNWVARIADRSDIAEIAPLLVCDLRRYIEGQGWPTIREEIRGNLAELESRSYGYESIGMLAKSYPEKLLLDPNLDLLRWLFGSLSMDGSNTDSSLSIEQALSSVIIPFSLTAKSEIREPLMHLLLHYAKLEPGDSDLGFTVVRSTRYVAVRFANRCLPYSNVLARWIDLLALSKGPSERREVFEEGKKGLDPYWYRILNPSEFNKDTSDGTMVTTSIENSRYAMPNSGKLIDFIFSNMNKATALSYGYGVAVVTCRTILFHEAMARSAKVPVIDADWERNIDAMIRNDEDARKIIANDFSSRQAVQDEGHKALDQLLDAAFTGFTDDVLEDSSQPGQCILDLCQFLPGKMLDRYSSHIPELKMRIYSNNHFSRILAGHIFGLLSAGNVGTELAVDSMIEEFWRKSIAWKSAIGSSVHQVHGSLLALAYWISRASVRQGGCHSMDRVEQMSKLVGSIMNDGTDKEILEAAVRVLGQLSLFGLLSMDEMNKFEELRSTPAKLEAMAKKGNEHAVHSMGFLAMQYTEAAPEQNSLSKIIDSLYNLHEIRQPELQFEVGAALSCAAVGWKSKSLVGMLDVEGSVPKSASRHSTLHEVIEHVLESSTQTKPSLRQASVIWLLCLVQYCGHCAEIQSRLRKCHLAFRGFLTDKDSLTQEAASRGLALIYENGDATVKEELIRDLVSSFTTTKSNLSGTVSEDTQLFEQGALPTGEGSSVTTYRDIVNLASEVGDPTLVYRFMSLASNSAIWSSRAAFGRFGLSRILSDSNTGGSLSRDPKLYSALFRYRFDPNTNVRAAMSQIWTALVKDPKATVDFHFDHILRDLLKAILNKEWRTRQASCDALADLIPGRPLAMYKTHLTTIWERAFKVCDDIKPTVCEAAERLVKSIAGVLLRSLEAGDESAANAHAMLEQVLPFLLGPCALEAPAQRVQGLALVTLIDIIKKASPKILRPYLAGLIGQLLALLSSGELEVVNYLHLNADKYGTTEQKIDDARLQSVKTSPIMEAIERCLDMLDETSMKDLQVTLTHAAKTVIGLPSKVGVSRVLVTLATRHRFIFQPYANGFFKIMQRQVLDRNDTISTTAAATCGYLSRIASDDAILKVIKYAKELYFESPDDRYRVVAGELLLGIAKYAPDRLHSLASDCLPFAFFGSHDIHRPAKDLFKAAWDDNVGGSRAVLLYLREIIEMSIRNLNSASWSIKHAAAFTVADTVDAAGNELSSTNSDLIWPALEMAIGGKTWDGKEKVLKALILFGKKSPVPKQSVEIKEQMQQIVIRESRRNNAAYRQHAFDALADLPELFTSTYWYETVGSVVRPILEDFLDDSDKMDIDDNESKTSSSKNLHELTIANGMRALLNSVTPVPESGIPVMTRLTQSLVLVRRGLARNSNTVASGIIAGEKSLFASLAGASLTEFPDQVLTDYCLTLFGLDDFAEAVRVQAAEAALALAPLSGRGQKLQESLRLSAFQARSKERSFAVQQALKAVIEACS